jgi:glucose-6-phosphate isomerase
MPIANAEFAALETHAKAILPLQMRDIFAADPERFKRFSVTVDGLTLDYSKNRIVPATMDLLFQLARASDIEGWRAKMFSGVAINETENRAVLHVALRDQSGTAYNVDGVDVSAAVADVLIRMGAFADSVRDGVTRGATGERITDVVNIGIGGSDLGPAMVTLALAPYHVGPRLHFVSNVDGAHLHDTLKTLNPATTLFLIASKTFTTMETMTNAASARDWTVAALGEDAVAAHFAALSTAISKVEAFGIATNRIFGFWDWVGGRYSVWSAIGLPVAMAVGSKRFEEFLAGGHAMDQHFLHAPLDQNLPVILGLIGVWYRNILGFPTEAVIAYDQHLSRFAAHLQQLDMESNGKGVAKDGSSVTRSTGPVVWGEPGTNGQHAFFQLIHQGTEVIPVDFLLAAEAHAPMGDHHDKLIANCLAQGQALMRGKTAEEVHDELELQGLEAAAIAKLAPHKVFPGNRPSNTLLYKLLTPFTLGRLLALYEHKVFVQGLIWDINSFDQWGVELGKQLASALIPVVKGEAAPTGLDASTAGLVETVKGLRG